MRARLQHGRNRLLDMALRTLQSHRTRRHAIHHPAQTKAHLPALVPPRHRARLHLVLGARRDRNRSLVRRHELLGARSNVLLLCIPRHAIQHPQMGQHRHNELANRSNDRRHMG